MKAKEASLINNFLFDIPQMLRILPAEKAFQSNKKLLQDFTTKTYEERRLKHQTEGVPVFRDAWDQLVIFQENYRKLGQLDKLWTYEEIRANFSAMYFAGADTTFHTLTNAIGFLVKHPELKKKIFGTIEEKIVKVADFKTINSADLEKCKDLDNFNHECLRLIGPVANSFYRKIIKDTKLNNKIVYKGDLLNFGITTAMNLETCFENAKEFDMDRFSQERVKTMDRNNYLPFSLGQRKCIGVNMGYLMLESFWVGFVKGFDLEIGEKFNDYYGLSPLWGQKDCFVKIKPKANKKA